MSQALAVKKKICGFFFSVNVSPNVEAATTGISPVLSCARPKSG